MAESLLVEVVGRNFVSEIRKLKPKKNFLKCQKT